MKRIYVMLLLSLIGVCGINAANVKVTMNATSTTMSLAAKESGDTIDVGEPTSKVYSFEAKAGTYVLTAYATDSVTVNGTIELNVTEEAEQEFTVLTNTAYVTNTDANKKTWAPDVDYTLEVTVTAKTGEVQVVTIGNSVTSGRKTFLALNGNSYYASFVPSAEHQAEGYMTLYRSATLTANVTVSGAIPQGTDYTISVPENAEFYVGLKFTHYTEFKKVEPVSTSTADGEKKITYHLAYNQVYNYRTWMNGGLTQGGYFKLDTDSTKCPVLAFTKSDYEGFGAKTINHDVQSNKGYETGDIFVNINEKGYLSLNVGETYEARAMRTWQLTDNSTNNYFIEPDFHYTVIDVNGNPSSGVIEIENSNTTTSQWSVIKAVGKGTAIVLVTYDAIGLNYYSGKDKKEYLGGQYWGAIWPENTAAYVVTVGEGTSSVEPNMLINEAYNTDVQKRAGIYVDAEHDVFYYLDTEVGAKYTFKPSNVAKIEIAYPTIGEQMATYKGFGAEGVTANEDSTYTLLLKEGRQIVRLTDANGNATYQVFTAKPCHREITNVSREGSTRFQPGDQIKIQYSGLRHPANKLAAIYNMSAYVTYNGTPNGTSLILSANQYTFGSVASAQAVTVTIPEDYDVTKNPEFVMDEGVIQVNGYGDPIGNHRIISRVAGRSPNFTAIAHKTYFGAIPEVRVPLTAVANYTIKFVSNVDSVDYVVTRDGNEVKANKDGTYTGTYGKYIVVAYKAGYRCARNSFVIEESTVGDQVINVNMAKADDLAWDGRTVSKPSANDDGVYLIATGAELAWFAQDVNGGNLTDKAVLSADVDLADYDWTPIGGTNSSKAFKGQFDGQGHAVNGLYINNSTATYQGLFGYTYGATVTISNLTVSGEVTAKQNASGIVAFAYNSKVDRCVNHANVTSENTSSSVGGVVGSTSGSPSVTNCYNTGAITGINNVGGVVGVASTSTTIENVYNIGTIKGTQNVGACAGGSATKSKMTNAFALEEFDITSGHTLVTEAQMKSGEVAYKLGEAFGQKIGEDAYPVLGGLKVYYNEVQDKYSNDDPSGVDTIGAEDATIVGYYDLQGRRLSKPQSGINIVRMSDGSVRKVYIKL